ncbi:MAG: ATP-binding protein [Melioribacteraceae bacterium]|nr:ATP-binding protein [Melioribacteraceae bacterium]
MYKIDENNDYISFEFSSDLKYIDRIIDDSIDFLKSNDIGSHNDFKIVVRELIINSIEHGNNNDNSKTVKCKISLVDNLRFNIEVEDEGDGFDYSKLDFKMPEDPEQHRNRGIPLINTLADQIDFNEKGNKINVIFSFHNETKFNVSNENGALTITPSGNITSSVADNFRVILLESLDENNENIVFNFEKVEDLDSISLSLLITFAKMFNRKFPNVVIKVISANNDIKNLFKLTRINKFYNITD